MRIAVLGDIHGNILALESVLSDIKDRAIDEVVFVGDAVGYGANPVECLDTVLESMKIRVAGNHDFGAVGKVGVNRFNKKAKAAIEWTATKLDYAGKMAIASMPLTAKLGEDIKFVHASPLSPESWHYIRNRTGIGNQFAAFGERICFIGHTHVPAVWCSDGSEREIAKDGDSMPLDSALRYIVNVGSVGQPRDRDSRSCYVIYDDEARSVVFRRVEYDIESAAKRIVDAGLPEYLALRLFKGI